MTMPATTPYHDRRLRQRDPAAHLRWLAVDQYGHYRLRGNSSQCDVLDLHQSDGQVLTTTDGDGNVTTKRVGRQ